jgi:outer membrane protein assembly factor BamE (lipoprotein component of BamABCDE complex)
MGRAGIFARQGIVARAAMMVLTLALAGCSPVFRDHGYTPSDEDLEQVVVGESTRETVAEVVGRPSSSGILAGSGWYYVSSQFRHYGARAPQEIERQVVAISFSDDGVVENVERFGLENGQAVVLSRRVTGSGIKGQTFLRQLLGNLGAVSAGQFLPTSN